METATIAAPAHSAPTKTDRIDLLPIGRPVKRANTKER
jgi:hypothetical protein